MFFYLCWTPRHFGICVLDSTTSTVFFIICIGLDIVSNMNAGLHVFPAFGFWLPCLLLCFYYLCWTPGLFPTMRSGLHVCYYDFYDFYYLCWTPRLFRATNNGLHVCYYVFYYLCSTPRLLLCSYYLCSTPRLLLCFITCVGLHVFSVLCVVHSTSATRFLLLVLDSTSFPKYALWTPRLLLCYLLLVLDSTSFPYYDRWTPRLFGMMHFGLHVFSV
jgi:hypothetical protein